MVFKRTAVALLSLVMVSSCGYSGRDAELVGQVKKVSRLTNLICSDYYAVDVSLGVVRNGTGSMSTQDVWIQITDESQLPMLRDAAEKGLLIKAKYDERRFPICTEPYIMTEASVTQ